jgi:RHS repeat-associated protein
VAYESCDPTDPFSAQQGADGQFTSDLLLCCSDPTPASTLVTLFGFDSRDNQTLTIDPKANTTVARFDGASRQTQTLQHMRLGGSGPNPPAGSTSFLEAGRGVIRTDVVLDGNGRVAELIDDRGAGTALGYDSLDRQVTLTFHDGSVRTNTFNAASDIVAYVDENGSAFAFTLDAIGRRTAVAITPAALTSLYGTTAQSFQYDGLSRMTFSQDSASTTSIVQPYYDSLGRVLEENQNIGSVSHYVTHNAWKSYPATGFTFPSSRQLTIGFDALYRKNTINETTGGASIAAWQFFGNRVATVTLGNGIICSFMNNAQSRSAIQAGQPTPPWGNATTDQLGYDGAGRVITKRYLLPTGGGSPGPSTLVVGFTTAYDRSSNKLFERHLHAETRSHLYPAYDSPDRLLQYQRGVLATGGASITTPISLPNTDSQRTYALDGLGNWNNTAYTPVDGSPTTEYRQHNYLNQITRYGTTPVTYDHGNNAASTDPNVQPRGNGNIADDGLRTYEYDALNRVSRVFRYNSDRSTSLIANYYYDALGRRTIKFVSNGGMPNDPALNAIWTYLYDGARVVEELNGTTAAQYVWGQYIDELIQLNAVMAIGPQGLTGKYYLLSDLLYRSVALTNSTGVVVEAYDTDAYGNTLLFKGPGTDGLWFTNDDAQAVYSACRYVFTGREYDAETARYFYRARVYATDLGRFLQRDPAGYVDGAGLYAYATSRPVVAADPLGAQIFFNQPIRSFFDPAGSEPDRLSGPGGQSTNDRLVYGMANWGMESGDMNHSITRCDFRVCDPTKYAQEGDDLRAKLYADLSSFASFNSGNNTTVSMLNPDYPGFSINGVVGAMSAIPDSRPFYVRLLRDPKTFTNTAVTLAGHPLVGIRKWWIELVPEPQNCCTNVIVFTEAYENDRGLLNQAGRRLGGESAQKGVWDTYCSNLVAGYSGAPGVVSSGSSPTRVNQIPNSSTTASQWRSSLPAYYNGR